MRLAVLLALADPQLGSQVPGLAILPLATLPAAPQDQGETQFCSHLFLDSPTTAAGRAAAAQGWHVTAEAPLGDLTAISFVGSATPATSGTCELQDGNIGLWSGDQLTALVYGTDAEDLLIGSFRPLGMGVRFLSGDLLAATTADLVYDGTSVTVIPPASEEPVCNATATVPGIENLPIDQARTLLLQSGWTPVPGDPEAQSFGMAKSLVAAGITEVADCAGTGLGFCAFTYTAPAGELSVITAGEGGEDGSLPAVVRYGVNCR